jgi:alkyldihydroxyacetonephosphate synthase
MRLQDRPKYRAGGAIQFPDFFTAARALQAISQAGLYPANCRILDAEEAFNTGAADGSAAIMVLAFESGDHPVEPWMKRAHECCVDHGAKPERTSGPDAHRKGAAGAWRNAFIRIPLRASAPFNGASSTIRSRPRSLGSGSSHSTTE